MTKSVKTCLLILTCFSFALLMSKPGALFAQAGNTVVANQTEAAEGLAQMAGWIHSGALQEGVAGLNVTGDIQQASAMRQLGNAVTQGLLTTSEADKISDIIDLAALNDPTTTATKICEIKNNLQRDRAVSPFALTVANIACDSSSLPPGTVSAGTALADVAGALSGGSLGFKLGSLGGPGGSVWGAIIGGIVGGGAASIAAAS